MSQIVQPADFVNLNDIQIGESLEDGSFTRTEGDSPSVTWKLVIRNAVDAYPAYVALIEFLKQRCWVDTSDENGPSGYIAMYDLPLNEVQISSLGCSYGYTATCTFAYSQEETYSDGYSSTGSSGSVNSRRHGTSPNNPVINESTFTMPEIEPNDFQFSTTGGSEHLTHSYATRRYELPTGRHSPAQYPSKDFSHRIGWNGEGFEGVDVVVAAEAFSITISAPADWVNPVFRQMLASTTGSVNAFPWFDYEAKCVLFKGATASPVALNYTDQDGNAIKDWYWRIRYEFEARRPVTREAPTRTYTHEGTTWTSYTKFPAGQYTDEIAALDAKIAEVQELPSSRARTRWLAQAAARKTYLEKLNTGGVLAGGSELPMYITKAGYQYAWSTWEKEYDSVTETEIPVEAGLYIEDVYPAIDFDILGLPPLAF